MIPDEAVEAAARALKRRLAGVVDDDDQWEWEHDALAALEAALPYLASAARQPQRTSPTDWPDVPRLP